MDGPPVDPPSPKPSSKSFAAALAQGLVKTYGQAVKSSFPPLSFSDDPVAVEMETKEDGFHLSIPIEEEWKLAKPFRWVVRGCFRGRRKSIIKVDEAIQQAFPTGGPFQVAPASPTEVLIRFQHPEDAIRLLSRSVLKIGDVFLHFIRWTPLVPNKNLAYSWCTIRELPPHLCSTSALQAILKPWASVLAVDKDARFLTRPEVVRVFVEIDAKDLPPRFFYLHSLGGTKRISLELQRTPTICSFCNKLGHVERVCRSRFRHIKRAETHIIQTGGNIPSQQQEMLEWKQAAGKNFAQANGAESSHKKPTTPSKKGKEVLSPKKIPRPSNSGKEKEKISQRSKSENRWDPFANMDEEEHDKSVFVKQSYKVESEFEQTPGHTAVEFDKELLKKPPLDRKILGMTDEDPSSPAASVISYNLQKPSGPSFAGQQSDRGTNPLTCSKCRKLGHVFCCCPFGRNEQGKENDWMEKQAKIQTNWQSKVMRNSHPSREVDNGDQKSREKANNKKDVNPPTPHIGSDGQYDEGKEKKICSLRSGENYDPCKSDQEDWEHGPRSSREGVQNREEPLSPSKSETAVSAKKSKYGPLQWSSLAGDVHLNYKLWGALEDEELQQERQLPSPKKAFDKYLACVKVPTDPRYKCRKCSSAKVHNKGNICQICAFQEPKRNWRKRPNVSPPKYEAKSAELFSNKAREDEWEIESKRQLLKRAHINIKVDKSIEGKIEDIPPLKKKWGDISSDEEDPMEWEEGKEEPADSPKGRGKRILSRINTSEELDPRRTYTSKGARQSQEGKREQWIEGIRLLKIKHYDQRHNTTWHQWEVAPDIKISRTEKKRIENIAHRKDQK